MAAATRTRWIPALVLLLISGGIWWARRGHAPQYATAYVNDRSALVWSTTAQVRQRVGELRYGQRVSVLGHAEEEVEVRSDDGVHGWVDAQLLMSPVLWQQATDLLARARSLPVQASGHTRALSNIHTEPSRTAARVFQFGRNVPVVVLERRVNAVPGSGAPASASALPSSAAPAASALPSEGSQATPSTTAAERAADGDTQGADSSGPGVTQPKQEDWLLVLHVAPTNAGTANVGVDIPIAGWVLARFVELDPPVPVADYASSAAVRLVAWMVLNHTPGGAAAGDGGKPQYLVAGTHGREGQPCDFTSLRVYTWGGARQRYETAYVESNLCGRFPIRTSATPDGAEFRFAELDEAGAERVYRMTQTMVRRVREAKPKAGNTR